MVGSINMGVPKRANVDTPIVSVPSGATTDVGTTDVEAVAEDEE